MTHIHANQTSGVLALARSPLGGFHAPQGPLPQTGRRFWLLPVIAGIGYGVAWVAGLLAWPSNLPLDASDSAVVSLYAAHSAQATAQYLLVEGLAGLCLGVVLLFCLRQGGQGDRPWRAIAMTTGGMAVVLSLTQCLLGLLLVSSASNGHLTQSGDLFGWINRMDGAKQLLLGATVVALAVRRRPGLRFPLWISRLSIVLALALIPSGLAYLLLWNALAGTTFISLPLLILWMGGTGLWLTRRLREG